MTKYLSDDGYEAIQKLMTGLRVVRGLLQGAAAIPGYRLEEARRLLGVLSGRLETLEFDLREEQVMQSHLEAFEFAERFVTQYCADLPHSELTIQVLAVSSTFSWGFITECLPRMLEVHPDLKIKLQVLLTDPETLRRAKAGISTRGTEWAAISERRKLELTQCVGQMNPEVASRFDAKLWYYNNIPHTHGLLIGGTQLILGRASWEWIDDIPHLRLGENEYRLFSNASAQRGQRRISLFQGWVAYYIQSGTLGFSTH